MLYFDLIEFFLQIIIRTISIYIIISSTFWSVHHVSHLPLFADLPKKNMACMIKYVLSPQASKVQSPRRGQITNLSLSCRSTNNLPALRNSTVLPTPYKAGFIPDCLTCPVYKSAAIRLFLNSVLSMPNIENLKGNSKLS